MPEIRNTTEDESLEIAIAKIREAGEMYKRRVDADIEKAIEDIKIRATAIPDLNGVAARATHAYVKDHHVHAGYHNPITLGGTSLRLTTGQELQMIEPLPWGAEVSRRADAPSLMPGKTYRFWLFVEEVQNAQGPETKEGR